VAIQYVALRAKHPAEGGKNLAQCHWIAYKEAGLRSSSICITSSTVVVVAAAATGQAMLLLPPSGV